MLSTKCENLKTKLFKKWHRDVYVCILIGKFVCGREGEVKTGEAVHPCHFHKNGTEKEILDVMKHVQQTVCRS
jgi:hypothetical protein